MDRRNFLINSSLSLAGLITHAPSLFNKKQETLLQFPDEAWANVSGQWIKLASADSQSWRGNAVEVLLNRVADSMKVQVKSPGQPLQGISLRWKNTDTKKFKILNDHWERTYGDVGWATATETKKLPWYFLHYDGKSTHCFGVKTGCGSICSWLVGAGLQLELDTRSGGTGVLLGERTLHAADIITSVSDTGETPFETGQRFCKMMCGAARLARQPVYGINDWYFSYGNSSATSILQHTDLLANLATDSNNRPFSVVDAGWAAYSPLLPDDCCWQDDFSRPNDKFRDMHKLAGDIGRLGMRPGLWTRPLCAAHDDKPGLLLTRIPGRDDPKKPVLDPSIPENIERIRRTINTYKEWGYEMVKHDFTTYDMLGKWGFEMAGNITTPGWRFNDTTKTTAEIILHLYGQIREAAGDMYLIGCNTLSHLSAGLFELNRTGDDTSGREWARTVKMGVNTLAFRGIQHDSFYAVDADCVGLTTQVPWSKNQQWMQLLANSGTPLFISAQPEAVGPEQKKLIKECFTVAARKGPVGQAVDWMDSRTPATWKLQERIWHFDWT